MTSTMILVGDVRQRLRDLPDNSVHCAVTSPPYFGLRDYGCDGQIGLEPTPDDYVAELVNVFREVRRVLREDGTLWLNLGDSYVGAGSGAGRTTAGFNERYFGKAPKGEKQAAIAASKPNVTRDYALAAKQRLMIPARVALALQADGWWLRDEIIWHKPNPMPVSVTDRTTPAHEMLYMFSKSARYHYDMEAVKEPALQPRGAPKLTAQHKSTAGGFTTNGTGNSSLGSNQGAEKRQPRSVWTVTPKPFKGAHFATFPPDLVRPCILAGCPAQCCSKCGAPVVREVERTAMVINRSERTHAFGHTRSSGTMVSPASAITTGWSATCQCNAPTIGGTVLDPFFGAGTTGLVAAELGRNAIGVELNPEYAAIARERLGLLPPCPVPLPALPPCPVPLPCVPA